MQSQNDTFSCSFAVNTPQAILYSYIVCAAPLPHPGRLIFTVAAVAGAAVTALNMKDRYGLRCEHREHARLNECVAPTLIIHLYQMSFTS